MYLIINTTLNQVCQAILTNNGQVMENRIWPMERKQAEQLLTQVDLLLRQNGVKKEQLKGIGVVNGPGGFSGLRIGITVANTLAFGLGVKVAGIKSDQFKTDQQLVKKITAKLEKAEKGGLILPYYDKEPNIT